MQPCSNINKIEKEAGSGEEDLTKLCTTESTAKETVVKQQGSTTGVKDDADVSMAMAEDPVAEEWIPGQLIELPHPFVDWILSQKHSVLEEDPDEYYNWMINNPDRLDLFMLEYLGEDRQLMRDIAEQYRVSEGYLEKFQTWVRGQLKTNGRVMVDDSFFARRIRIHQAFKEAYARPAHGFEGP
jgi:hypothetical protein